MSNPNNKKDALGKGIRSLLQSIDQDLKTTSGTLKPDVVEKTTSSNFVSIDLIEVNPRQPRQDFDEESMKELAASIKMHGIIQPLTVSKTAGNRYRLVAGDKRPAW